MRLSWSSQRQKLLFQSNGKAFNTANCRGSCSVQLRPLLNCKMRLWQLWTQSIWESSASQCTWGIIKKLLNTFWVASSTLSSFLRDLMPQQCLAWKYIQRTMMDLSHRYFSCQRDVIWEGHLGFLSLNEIFTTNSLQPHHHHHFWLFSSICLVTVWFQLLWKK